MAETDPASPPPPPRRKKPIVMLGVTLLLAGGGAAGAWLVTQRLDEPLAAAGVPERKTAKTPHFLTLEPFVVNLQDPGGERYAQIGVTLQFEDPMLEVSLKQRLPAVRNNILLLISSKRTDELLTTDGKQLLASQIRTRAAQGLGLDLPASGAAAGKRQAVENPIQDVLFAQFIVQ